MSVSRLCLLLCLWLWCALLAQCASHRAPQGATASPLDPEGHGAAWSRATARLAAAVPADEDGRAIRWRFAIRKNPGTNAVSWPDGRVEVTSGALIFVKDEAELAAIAAHEMAHVFLAHGRHRAWESVAVVLGGAALGAVMAARHGDPGTALGVASGAVLTVSLTALTARQRAQECEADRVSLDLMRRAGYPPSAAVRFWQRYAAARAGYGLGGGHWWKSHPADAERVQRLQEAAASR